MGGVDARTFARLELAATQVADRLADQQRIYVNRELASSVRALRAGRLSTIFERAREGADIDPGALAVRRALERRLGTHGTGANAGRTVYGSLQFTDQLAPVRAPTGMKLAVAHFDLPEVANPGSMVGGPVAWVLKPEVLARSRFLSADTFEVGQAMSAPRERIPAVMTERLLRDAGVLEDFGEQPWRPLFAPAGARDARAAVTLLASDPARAERSIQRLVTGRNMADFPQDAHYIEAQVIGGVALDDVERISLHPGLRDLDGRTRGLVRQMEQLAHRRGIPVSYSDPR